MRGAPDRPAGLGQRLTATAADRRPNFSFAVSIGRRWIRSYPIERRQSWQNHRVTRPIPACPRVGKTGTTTARS
ncbi:hypothetical protein [Lysobacter gummosus]|uniref:hypothetical protein n=1 Tax=Lysobacter gummosus TaxID=262324 RepID=UPI0036384698